MVTARLRDCEENLCSLASVQNNDHYRCDGGHVLLLPLGEFDHETFSCKSHCVGAYIG